MKKTLRSLPIEEILILENLEEILQTNISFTEYIEGITNGWEGDYYYIEDYRIVGLKIRTPIIETVPKLIGDFRKLKYLNLSHNYLKYLPVSIGKLKNLEILNLARNNFKKIPMSFRNLENLRELNLKYNKLSKIPSMLRNIITLDILYLDGNPIDRLPEELRNLKKDSRKSRYRKYFLYL